MVLKLRSTVEAEQQQHNGFPGRSQRTWSNKARATGSAWAALLFVLRTTRETRLKHCRLLHAVPVLRTARETRLKPGPRLKHYCCYTVPEPFVFRSIDCVLGVQKLAFSFDQSFQLLDTVQLCFGAQPEIFPFGNWGGKSLWYNLGSSLLATCGFAFNFSQFPQSVSTGNFPIFIFYYILLTTTTKRVS